MEFKILGTVRVHEGDADISLGSAKERLLLAILAARRNSTVTLDQLVEWVWSAGDSLDIARRHRGVHTYVSRLRDRIELDKKRPSRLLTVGHGYQLHVDAGQLDLDVFDERVALAASHRDQGAWDESLERLNEALGLWTTHGELEFFRDPLALWYDIGEPIAERWLIASEDRFEALIALGRRSLLPELREFAMAHPYRARTERLYVQGNYAFDGTTACERAIDEYINRLTAELGLSEATAYRERLDQEVIDAPSSLLVKASVVRQARGLGVREEPLPHEGVSKSSASSLTNEGVQELVSTLLDVPFDTERLEKSYRMGPNRRPTEVVETRVARALKPDVMVTRLGVKYSADPRPDAEEFVALEGAEITRTYWIRGGYNIIEFAFPRPLAQWEQTRFTWKRVLRSEVQSLPYNLVTPVKPMRFFRMHISFDVQDLPEAVWIIEGIPMLDPLPDPNPDNLLHIDRLGEVSHEFHELAHLRSYGIHWRWPNSVDERSSG